ncbi:MAG TPA: hypothetical protein VFE67_13455 [Rudaea sp.]|nr:hypothetical protein [Rudaea sp.]
MKTGKLYFARLCTLLLPLALAACGGGASVKAPANDSVLEKRSLERWNLLIAHKAEKAYDYLSPGTRSTETREKYASDMNNRPVHWQSVTYVDRKCDDPDACTLQLQAFYSVNMSARIGQDVQAATVVWERWIRVGGQWYYLPERSINPASKH